MPLTIGDRLGPYEVTGPLGKGGMGEVYRGFDSRVHREVAIKTTVDRFTERFEREARAIAALNHPNVCTLYDVGPDYLIMELVEGPTLADRIRAGAISLDESLKLAAQIADALSAAHRKGVIHRDLKPGNIKVTPDGRVKVLDFGLAKVAVLDGSTDRDAPYAVAESPTLTTPAVTQAGVVLGTAAYMSPEQAKGKPVDKTADIWAFGVVLYEMLTGRQLHQGESVSETLASVLKETPDLTRLPIRVRRLLRSCLQKDPEQRLHEIADWKLLLDEDQGELLTQSPARMRWLWPAVAALLFVTAAALGVVLFRKSAPGAPEVRSQIPQPEGLIFNAGTQAAISPDGRWLAFPAADRDNISRMYVRSIDSLDVRPMPGSEGIPYLSPPPFWSYDSRFVVYGAQGKLKKSEITGTPAQTIADTGLPFVQGGTWNRDGVILYAKVSSNLEQVSSDGATPAAVTKLATGETAHRWPQFLPDGRRFLYLRASSAPDKTGIYVGSLDVTPEAQGMKPLVLTDRQAWWVSSERSGKTYLLIQREEALLAQPFDPGNATLSGTPVPVVASGVGAFATATSGLWSVARSGALVYRSGGAGLPQPTWVDSAGRSLGSFGEPRIYVGLALSPDGKHVAFASSDGQRNADIWVKEIASGANTRLTFDPGADTSPVWSPDGRRIVYAAARGARRDLYEKNADGSGEERLLLQSDQDKTPTSWSRDGRFLLYSSVDSKTRDDIWILPLDENRKPFPFLRTDAQEGLAQLSPDERWIAYQSFSSGGADVFVRPFSPDSRSAASSAGAQWMISTNGGLNPRWSADGRRLFYLSLNGDLMAVDVRAGASFQNRPPQRLFGAGGLQSLNVSPTGDRFLFLRPSLSAGPPPPFTLVLNWMTKLEQ